MKLPPSHLWSAAGSCVGFPRLPSPITIGWPTRSGMAHGITMSAKTTQRSWTRLRAILLTPSLILVVDPVGISATFVAWDMKPWAWTGRRNSWPWRAPIPDAKFFIRIFLRWHCPRPFHGVFANASLFHVPSKELPRVLRELNEPCGRWRRFSVQTRRGTTRRVERRSLLLLLRSRDLARLCHRGWIFEKYGITTARRGCRVITTLARDGLAQGVVF